jgi:hypothetical protein
MIEKLSVLETKHILGHMWVEKRRGVKRHNFTQIYLKQLAALKSHPLTNRKWIIGPFEDMMEAVIEKALEVNLSDQESTVYFPFVLRLSPLYISIPEVIEICLGRLHTADFPFLLGDCIDKVTLPNNPTVVFDVREERYEELPSKLQEELAKQKRALTDLSTLAWFVWFSKNPRSKLECWGTTYQCSNIFSFLKNNNGVVIEPRPTNSYDKVTHAVSYRTDVMLIEKKGGQ